MDVKAEIARRIEVMVAEGFCKPAASTHPRPIKMVMVGPYSIFGQNALACKKCGEWVEKSGLPGIYSCSGCNALMHENNVKWKMVPNCVA